MHDSQDDFTPMLIEQQLEQPDTLLIPADARLVHEIRAMFEQEKHEWLEQGWTRLVSRRAHTDQAPEVLELSTYKQHHERTSTMHEQSTPVISPKPTPKKSVIRLLNLSAAVLVCLTLVGSLTLIFAASRNQKPSTSVGSHIPTPTTQIATPIPTPLTIPPACKDSSYPTEEALCAKGEETNLNMTKSVTLTTRDPHGRITGSSTIIITFLRAYADPSQLLLTYTIDQAPNMDWGGLVTLSTSQGILGSHGNGLFKGFYVQSFDTSSISLSITQFQIQTVMTAFGAAIPLNFTLPFHNTRKIVPIKQTMTSNGYALTLDNLILTGSATNLFYSYTSQFTSQRYVSIEEEVQAITINGQKQIVRGGYPSSFSGNPTSGNGITSLSQALLNQPGTWMVTLALVKTDASSGSYTVTSTLMTATFTFTVPA